MLSRAEAFLALAFAATGCAGTVSSSGSPGDAEPTVTTSALIAVERMADSSDGTHAEASARFIRTAASSPDDALRSVGAVLDLPSRGACASIASLVAAAAPSDVAPTVELVDVGAVSIEVGSTQTILSRRQLPDVTDVVSGLIYARTADPAVLPAEGRYLIHVDGKGAFGGFDVLVSAPVDPSDIRFDGSDVQGSVPVSGNALDLSWAAHDAPDTVYVDVQPSATRCVLAGEPSAADALVHASIPASAFDPAGTLVVHRLRTERLRASAVSGLDAGEVRFDFARTIAYARP